MSAASGALELRRLGAFVPPENAPSIRIAEKGGFSLREEAVYKGEPILLFRRPAASD